MIRQLTIFVFTVTLLFAGTCLLSYIWQFGYVGPRGSIGLRESKVWYVSRSAPILDPPGFYIAKGSAANRAMYGIDGKADWTKKSLRAWAFGLPAAAGYLLALIYIRRRSQRPASPWLVCGLAIGSILALGLWVTSQFATVAYSGSRACCRIGDGTLSVALGPQYAAWLSPGWQVQWGKSPFLLDAEEYFASRSGVLFLNLPLSIAVLAFLPPTIVFTFFRPRRPGHCKRCSYNLTGNVTGVCPECGSRFSVAADNEQGDEELPRGWLTSRIAVYDAETDRLVKDDPLRSSVPLGLRNQNWGELVAHVQVEDGDEIWAFRSPKETWVRLAGRAGFALVRRGRVINTMLTMMS